VDLLKTWLPVTVYLAGQPIALKLKAIPFGEFSEFYRRIDAYNRLALEGKALDVFEAFTPTELRDWFGRWVRIDGDLEFDGERIITGDDLLRIATLGIVREVIGKLLDFGRLSEAEGKGSSSPSTSEPARATSDGDSPATSIESADGTGP
jgi:hypothetical protein